MILVIPNCRRLLYCGLLFLIVLTVGCSGDGSNSSGGLPGNPDNPDPGFPSTTYTYTLPGGTVGSSITINLEQVTGKKFKTGEDDSGTATVSTDFWIAETETTYELWHAVYIWAVTNYNSTGKRIDGGNLYSLTTAGQMGSDNTGNPNPAGGNQQPVTMISWRSAMVWCNALTEYYNANNNTGTDLDCVFYVDSNYATPLRDSNGLITSDPYVKSSSSGNTNIKICTAKGFRLPSVNEWQLAARFIEDKNGDGDICDIGEYYAGDAVSGDTTGYCCAGGLSSALSSVVANFAVFKSIWNGSQYIATGVTTTVKVKSKNKNAVGLYDMSGNVFEYCYELDTTQQIRYIYGTSFIGSSRGVGRYSLGNTDLSIGFRIVQTK